RDLVEVALRRPPGAEVQELPDPGVHQVPDHPVQEGAVLPRDGAELGRGGEGRLGRDAVGLVVVLSTEVVVVHPGGMGDFHLQVDGWLLVLGHYRASLTRTAPCAYLCGERCRPAHTARRRVPLRRS